MSVFCVLGKSEKKVQFSEEVEVKTVEPVAEELEIDEVRGRTLLKDNDVFVIGPVYLSWAILNYC